jgi:hypothetical protein
MMFKRLMGALALVVTAAISTAAVADSVFLDREPLYGCGGTIDLRQAYNGDLSIKFNNLDLWACQTLKVYDSSSGRTLNSYTLSSPDASYTLSKNQLESLSDDCSLGLRISGSRRHDKKKVQLRGCRPGPSYPSPRPPYGVTYEWSNVGNCKKMINGQYSGENVSSLFCLLSPRPTPRPAPRVSYEWSHKGNCKKMIDGVFTGEFASEYYCRH